MDVQPFTDWLATILGIAFALVGIVSALVAAIKTAAGESLPARYYPVLAVVVGVVVAIAIGMVMPDELRRATGLSFKLALVIGGVAGLMAAGLFSYGKTKEIVGP